MPRVRRYVPVPVAPVDTETPMLRDIRRVQIPTNAAGDTFTMPETEVATTAGAVVTGSIPIPVNGWGVAEGTVPKKEKKEKDVNKITPIAGRDAGFVAMIDGVWYYSIDGGNTLRPTDNIKPEDYLIPLGEISRYAKVFKLGAIGVCYYKDFHKTKVEPTPEDEEVKKLREKIEANKKRVKLSKEQKLYSNILATIETMVRKKVDAARIVLNNLKVGVIRLERDLKNAQRKLKEQEENRKSIEKRYKSLQTEMSKEFDPKIDLTWLDKYERIEYKEPYLHFKTKMIYIPHVVKSETAREVVKIPMGIFEGRFDIDTIHSSFTINNISTELRPTATPKYSHPHISNGRVCWGDFPVHEYVESMDVILFLANLVVFLESYNPSHPYIGLLDGWKKNLPKEDTICEHSQLFRYLKEGRDPSLVSQMKYCPKCDLVENTCQKDLCDIPDFPRDLLKTFCLDGHQAFPSVIKAIKEYKNIEDAFKKIVFEAKIPNVRERSNTLAHFFTSVALHIRSNIDISKINFA